jgi:branched-chain amino acid transport system permease protein
MLPLLASIPFINDRFFNWTLIGQLFVNGLKNGAIYAAMALTVVIIYKTTGHLNFAQGEMGALGAFLVYVFAIEHGWPYAPAILLAVGLSMVLGAAMERTLIRPIERRSALGVVIITLGVFLIINSLNAVIWGTNQLTPVTPFPRSPTDQFVIAEGPPRFAVTYGTIGIWIVLGVVVVALSFFFQKTKLGLGYRAVAANRESSLLVGVPVGRMLMLGWAISAGLGTLAAVLVSQSTNNLDFNLMATVLLYGFAAAALGGFDSILGAVVGGFIVGLAEAFIPSIFSFVGSELSLAVALLVIVIVLLVRPQGLFGSKRVERV